MVGATLPFQRLFKCVFLLILSHRFCNASDTISPLHSLYPNQTIVSNQAIFELGFFTPLNSDNHYVGIWYKDKPLQSVWIGNRNTPVSPISFNTSRLEMDKNGNLNLIVNSQIIWTLTGTSNATEAVLLDNGNLVFRNASGVVWRSFDHPIGSWLPGGVIGVSKSEAKLTSWRNASDPRLGNYTLVMEGGELFMKKNSSQTVWRSGVWRNGSLPSLPGSNDLYNISYVRTEDSEFMTYSVYKPVTVRIVLLWTGTLFHYVWSEARRGWLTLAVQPPDPNSCRDYVSCGGNTMCDANYLPSCRCLDGFVPREKRDWDLLDFSSGCVRGTGLRCDKKKTVFEKVSNSSWRGSPESQSVDNIGECESACLADCSCSAYANTGGECLLFKGDLLNLETALNNSSGADVYIRMESGDAGSAKGRRNVLVLALTVPLAAAAILVCCFFLLRPKLKTQAHQNILLLDLNPNGGVAEKNSEYELPFFSFSSIAAATNNFSNTNKLGEGGFGPVYKGELANGQFVAIKRLSRSSGQGLEEFRNETELIAKLQHRNLVGIIGCCTENDENILVYEYMPNKSLDFLLFESNKKEQLDWTKRFVIISGIAQGLLYLHHYSRLTMVHRDLKASNILLDAEMNPKISDFGMARIFGGSDSLANTKRIVGTYGYMSPEYAMKGVFSVKSDVYSFGVLMLEIITGKTISGFYGSDRLSLLEYAFNIWKQEGLEPGDTGLEITGSSSSSSPSMLMRCMQIGLLCVQENPADRPLMSDVVGMLNNDQTMLPMPQHPPFSVGKPNPSETKADIFSVNRLTVSQLEPR